jgi:hypothetical protein
MLVRVFRNITKGPRGSAPVYSVQAKGPKGWRTVAHAAAVELTAKDQGGVAFPVSAAGVARIRATGRKQVVATVVGHLVAWLPAPTGGLRPAAADLDLADVLADYALGDPASFAPSGGPWWQVSFNPYAMDTFQAEGRPLRRAHGALIGPSGVRALGPLDTFTQS